MKKQKLFSVISFAALCTLASCGINTANKTTTETTIPVTTTVATTTEASMPTTTVAPTTTTTITAKPTTTATTTAKPTTTATTTAKPTTTATTTAKPTTTATTTAKPTTTATTTTKPTTTATTTAKPTTTATTTTIQVPEQTKLDILSINDLHGYAYEASGSSRTNYSLASTAYYIEQVRKEQEYDNVILAANGDMFQGTAFSNLSHGKSVINAMNQMGFDFMGIGNHEFDWGLEEVLNYWDLDETNGEANFPLINGNVDYTAKNQFGKEAYARVGEAEDDDNIIPYTIVEKSGIKVGLLSYIGPQSNDINQNKLTDFSIDCSSNSDTLFYNQVKKDAKALKAAGADILVVNLHNGTSGNTGATTDEMNKKFATMKDADGNYYFDAIINGHTHSYQSGAITRTDGVAIPVVQAGSYGNAIGRITLNIDTVNKKVTSVASKAYEYIDSVNPQNKKIEAVDEVLQYEYALIKNQINDVYCVNMSNSSREQLGAWTVNIMKQYSGADIAFINTGGIRSDMKATNVTIAELYEVNPFDNNLCYIKAKGSEIKAFYNSNTGYYYFNDGFDVSTLNDSTIYKVITIDYVYYSTYFKKSFTTATLDYEDTKVYARTLMQLDCQSKKATGLDLSSSKAATLAASGWKTK